MAPSRGRPSQSVCETRDRDDGNDDFNDFVKEAITSVAKTLAVTEKVNAKHREKSVDARKKMEKDIAGLSNIREDVKETVTDGIKE